MILQSLLKQDGHLPEASVKMFGLDIVAALKVYIEYVRILCKVHPCICYIWSLCFLYKEVMSMYMHILYNFNSNYNHNH